MIDKLDKKDMLKNMKKFNIMSFNEPIFKDISFNYKGYKCVVNRYSSATQGSIHNQLKRILETSDTKEMALLEVSLMMVWFCGYVYIPFTDPIIEKAKLENNVEDYLEENIFCHGGITYINEEDYNNNHYYKIGFDCNHYTDNTRPFSKPIFKGQYQWNFDNVSDEVKKMVDEIIKESKK